MDDMYASIEDEVIDCEARNCTRPAEYALGPDGPFLCQGDCDRYMFLRIQEKLSAEAAYSVLVD